MESHPVPQNVTTFEFHLIGDMTIKQFIFLASGLAVAYLTFILFSKSVPVIAYPVIAISASAGAAFAFLPIMERPLDWWLVAFVKAIFNPTQFKFKSKKFEDNPLLFNNRLEVYLNTVNLHKNVKPGTNPAAVLPKPVATPQAQFATGLATDLKLSQSQINPVVKPVLKPESLDQSLKLIKRATELTGQISSTEGELNSIKTQAALAGADPKQFSQQFQDVLTDLQRLNKDAAEVSRQMAGLGKVDGLQRPIVQAKIVPMMSLTEIPNIINGVVADSQGSYLEGAIIIAHDTGGLPVRALKTNKLGQFVTATPLPNGIYNLTVEKEDLIFDITQVDLHGQVLKPLFVKAKRLGANT